MSKALLQVLVDDAELRELRTAAKSEGLDLPEWVRRQLRAGSARRRQGDLDTKLAAIRVAVAHDGPTADIDQMLSEIGAGYGPTHFT